MRSESDVLGALLRWGIDDDNVRAIYLNGSRADPSRELDQFSDFDVAVIVRDTARIRDGGWIRTFGEPMVTWPLTPQPTFDEAWITQLVLYTDGVRIDFQFTTPDLREIERPGPYHCVLLDLDALSESISGVPIAGTRINPPDEAGFADRINAFWWDVPYVAKALKRNELDYARFVAEDLRFHKLHPLIRWHIGVTHGPDTDVGIFGRWFQRHLDDEIWGKYRETFSGADLDDQWRAMFAMCRFVRHLGQNLAEETGLSYPNDTDRQVSAYLNTIRKAPCTPD